MHGPRRNNYHGPRCNLHISPANACGSCSLEEEYGFLSRVGKGSHDSVNLNVPDRQFMTRLCSGEVPSLEISNPLRHNFGKALYNQGLEIRSSLTKMGFKPV